MNRLDNGQQNGPKTTIHTIVKLEEKIKIGSNVLKKASELIDTVGNKKNDAIRDQMKGIDIDKLNIFYHDQQGDQPQSDTRRVEGEDNGHSETPASKQQIPGNAKNDEWGKDGIKYIDDKKEDEQYPEDMYDA